MNNYQLESLTIKKTTEYLSSTINYYNISSIFKKTRPWAIIGGVVRDCLIDFILKKSPSNQYPHNMKWPDFDIAYSEKITERDISDGWQVSKNSFNGFKLTDKKELIVDIWSIPQASIRSGLDWSKYLNKIDFTVNAVAFIYPERKILIHPQWFKDLNERIINRLNQTSPKQNYQIVRAIALASKLSILMGKEFNISENIYYDFKCLTRDSSEKNFIEALAYLKQKVISGRWDMCVIEKFNRIYNNNENYNENSNNKRLVKKSIADIIKIKTDCKYPNLNQND